MKRFTIIFSILLVLGFAGTLAYVGMSQDFVNPAEAAQLGEDAEAPIWSMTMEEVLAELEDQGLIDRSGDQLLAASGLCSDAIKVSNGAEFYWWDLENLDEDSQEYVAYKQLKEEGIIDVYGSGNIMSPIPNGPFAMLLSFCDGDVNALDKAFRAVGQLGGGDDANAPVWNMTMDDMLDFLEENGFLTRSDVAPLTEGTATEAFNFNGADLYWWDLDNLGEDSPEAISYHEMQDEGIIDLWQMGQYFMNVTQNGPFGLNIANYNGDATALLDAFSSFGRNSGGGADDKNSPVWSMTLDDLAAYMADQGVVDAADYININYSTDRTGRVGYRFSNVIDIEHYDLENLDEASQEEYDTVVATGAQVYVNGQVGYFYVNGPFVLHFYEWGKTQVPEEDQPGIIEIFQAFGRE